MVTEEQSVNYMQLLEERKAIHKKTDKLLIRIILFSYSLGIIAGISILIAAIKADRAKTMPIERFIPAFILLLLLLLIVYLLHIVLHETGHLLFGLLTGYRFLSFRILSIILYKKNGELHIGKHSINGLAGQCLMYPPSRRDDKSFPFILYFLGGGIINLTASLLMVIPIITTENSYVRVISIVILLVGLILTVSNLVPLSIGIPNDGMNVKSMLQDKNMQDAVYLQLQLNAEMSGKKMITDYSPEIFELSEGICDTNTVIAIIRLYSYFQKLAFHDYQGAEIILSAMEQKSEEYQPIILNLIESERLFFMLIQHRPIEEIAAFYERFRLIFAKNNSNIGLQRIHYIYEIFMSEEEKKDIMTLIKGKLPDKWKVCDQDKIHLDFKKAAEKYPVSGEAAMHVEIADYVKYNFSEKKASC
jgi:hypothetical protein